MNFKGTDEVQKAYDYIKKANENISDSKEKITNLIKIIENSSWSGEAKKNFLNLIMLCEKLNDKLSEVSKENVIKISEFIYERDEFIKDELIIKNLEE